MKIPKLSPCCDLEILPAPYEDRRLYGGVLLRVTTAVNGRIFATNVELTPDRLDDPRYGEHVIREMEVAVGRAIVRGEVPDDPQRRRVEYVDAPLKGRVQVGRP